ncbi:ABC transporter ATP-binding protein [Nocardiopsis sediminis]|uniref:Spermidine/putrescine import ATP-binding protein PotA n=1 Tax=Nocardiopsis sediminis TaxID=1778267 RepID=A0ABV8FRQ4_9ACTN
MAAAVERDLPVGGPGREGAGTDDEHVLVEGLTAGYDGTGVLDVDRLAIRRGEFLSILGPSGCGKTTLLNSLAGFVLPTGGRITIDGADLTDVPPHRRGLGMVFQNYALFPHMTVAENVAYGLRVRRVERADRIERVAEALRLVGLEDYARRRPRQLSGGQQQRVAVARALATRPAVLLLDEPLSNLDAKLRREMRVELRELQQRLGITMVFVTHDQEEAMSLSDRIAVLNGGRVEQLGTPQEVYAAPVSRFVAEFVGAANVFEGVAGDGGELAAGDARVRTGLAGLAPGRPAAVALRPEKVAVGAQGTAVPEGRGSADGVLVYRAFLGDGWQAEIELAGGASLGARTAAEPPLPGTQVTAHWSPDDVIRFAGPEDAGAGAGAAGHGAR